jgi:hypothetical protein
MDLHSTTGLSATDAVCMCQHLLGHPIPKPEYIRQMATGRSLGRETSTAPQRHPPWISDILFENMIKGDEKRRQKDV